jgi:hypothetical protein
MVLSFDVTGMPFAVHGLVASTLVCYLAFGILQVSVEEIRKSSNVD